jgi:hypothetical protein
MIGDNKRKKNASIRDRAVICVLLLLYLVPAVVISWHKGNLLDWNHYAAFMAAETGLTLTLSVLSIICCALLIGMSSNYWLKIIGFLGLPFPLFTLFIYFSWSLS